MEAFIAHWGYLAIVIGTVLEGEAVLVAAGAMAHHGLLSLPWVMAAAFAGSLIGDQLWFFLGHRYGMRWLRARPHLLARANVVQSWLDKYGVSFLIGFRFFYGLRTVTPVLLGATGFSPRRFAMFNLIGGAAWATSFGALGFGMGAGFKAMLTRHGHAHELLLVGATVAVLSAAIVLWRARQRRIA